MKFPVLWSGLGCYTVKCSEILAHIELLYNPRVNKVLTSLHFTPGPSQPLLPELEEEEDEDEVLFREKADDDGEDEGVISDYESEAEMSEEMVLEKLEKYLL